MAGEDAAVACAPPVPHPPTTGVTMPNPSTAAPASDPVNHPRHYTSHPSGVECITVTRHMGFNLGNAVKYIWRADLKADAIQDLEKAVWYLQDEITKRKRAADNKPIAD
jgi:hypothetical protein